MKREEAEQMALSITFDPMDPVGMHNRFVTAIMVATEIQQRRDAELCRRLQVESRKRVELGFTCAKEIEEQDEE